ncbi:hypothetical protein F6R98_09340 [Candidatus Methylospira mobilis]|uniref:Uracil-DNA glycosylase n=1 Tax=Candidatus Methylospira mobilis TaxID=1808979 RepID=A0A5Q0BKZ9_9GAMM|nr:hypothetical protein F6R98_09340 [Candidatus Methylospira mobilis]
MDTEADGKRPDCNNCTHYYITYDANFRYGCRAFGFKSRQLPAVEVIEASGEQCHCFQKKKHARR